MHLFIDYSSNHIILKNTKIIFFEKPNISTVSPTNTSNNNKNRIKIWTIYINKQYL